MSLNFLNICIVGIGNAIIKFNKKYFKKNYL